MSAGRSQKAGLGTGRASLSLNRHSSDADQATQNLRDFLSMTEAPAGAQLDPNYPAAMALGSVIGRGSRRGKKALQGQSPPQSPLPMEAGGSHATAAGLIGGAEAAALMVRPEVLFKLLEQPPDLVRAWGVAGLRI